MKLLKFSSINKITELFSYRNYLPKSEALIRKPISLGLGGGGSGGASKIQCATGPGYCRKNRYRSFDGTCNNLERTAWGAANGRFDI